MYSCKLTIIGRDTGGDSVTKDFAGVNRKYIAQIGYEHNGEAGIGGVELPGSFTTFWEWADAVARGINGLTTNTYDDARITAIFNTSQEMA